MRNQRHRYKSILLKFLVVICPLVAWGEEMTKDKVTVWYKPLEDGTILVQSARNRSSQQIILSIDGRGDWVINADSGAQIQKEARKIVKFDYAKNAGPVMWRFVAPPAEVPTETQPPVSEEKKKPAATVAVHSPQAPRMERKPDRSVSRSNDYPLAIENLNNDPFFGIEAVEEYVNLTDSLSGGLSSAEDKTQFIEDNDIEKFLSDSERMLRSKRDEISLIARQIIDASKISDSSSQISIINSVVEILHNRLNQREQAYDKLEKQVKEVLAEPQDNHSLKDSIINYSIVGAIVLIVAIWMLVAVRRKSKQSRERKTQVQAQPTRDDTQAIVVRRRTTSILKKQCIDDVIDNPAYLMIQSSDFTTDSAVRRIYIKNTCIKEVYNLYAEDLRDSDNPKEDGCMVLGRWVLDESSHTYDVSLETVIFPGDDAVFKEYELNFGGKIKLRIAERLRKLRRETNLQYDLVCWIHSHPGLGVFFSNSDDNVQMQLKHSQHPNFLTAFVVDILTSDQETGIFTFKKDGTMNSKGDLTRMYSLEEMYRWALESEKESFTPENYFDILQNAKVKMPSCKGIELNNSAIIDLTQILVQPAAGIAGWVIGTSCEKADGREFVVSGIVGASEKPTAGKVGMVLNLSNFSLPTVQRLIAGESADISFVLVYSSREMTLTSIPVINGEVITDEQFYGNEKIDDLKIWTRRRR